MSPRWQLTPRRLVGPVAEQVVSLHDLVNLASALVDHRALAIAIEAAHRVLVRIAVRAVNLHGVTGGALGRHRREPFRQAGFAGVAAAFVLEPSGASPQQPRRLVVRLHLRNQLLDELMRADLDAERLALFRVLHARVAARANEAGGASRDGVAALVERKHRDLEPLALAADEILRRHLDVLHLEEPGVAGEDAPLLRQRSARESLERALDDERAHPGRVALLLLLQIAPRKHEEVVGNVGQGDPHLLASEQIAIAFLDGDSLNAARIAARRRLRQPISRDLLALCLRNEIALLLILGAPREQRQASSTRRAPT